MHLDDLINQVQDAAGTEEPLDRLAAAMGVKADFDDLTDSLIGHFVDQARRAGCSWSEIGSAMGVTKQAAQQRHTAERPTRERRGPRMPVFRRYTQRARTAVREAEASAHDLGQSTTGTEHLLLGILAVPRCLAAETLSSMGLTPKLVVDQLEVGVAPRQRGRMRHTPFTEGAKQVLEQSLGEALKLGHNYVGTEHLLLALFEAGEGRAVRILDEAGITRQRALDDILERLRAAS